MARLSKEELESIKNKYNVSRIWSWSRVNCFNNSSYEYYLKYILRKQEDRSDSIYLSLGSAAHECLEDFYMGKIKFEEMSECFDDNWMTCYDISQLKFDRSDETKNETIASKYHDNLVHFFKHHTPIKHKVLIEKPITIKVGSNIFVGYIDLTYKDDEGCYHIIDHKTSSLYKGAKADKECGQLVLYGMGLHQAGVPLDKIKIGWHFMKYATIQYQQKNGAVKTRDVERSKIGESLQSNAKMWLKTCGYTEDEIDVYLKLLLDTNSIDVLPDEVQSKYVISDCLVYIDLTDKLINHWTDYIIATIRDIAARELDYKEDCNDLVWWDSEESIKQQSYYFANLCGYSAQLHKPYAEYIEKLDQEKQGNNLFANVGIECEDYVESAQTGNVICNNKDDLDLSWLNDLGL